MTVQQAIHIVSEEVMRLKRLAEDLAEDPLDHEGRAIEHAKRYREKAEEAEKLVKVARAFNSAGRE